ncbi:MAG TPA: hypothetical protein VEX68_09025 [Bryobacteraceae bacterium]|nr:hypothetical protein [Bryobacteraceae bacterium]
MQELVINTRRRKGLYRSTIAREQFPDRCAEEKSNPKKQYDNGTIQVCPQCSRYILPLGELGELFTNSLENTVATVLIHL